MYFLNKYAFIEHTNFRNLLKMQIPFYWYAYNVMHYIKLGWHLWSLRFLCVCSGRRIFYFQAIAFSLLFNYINRGICNVCTVSIYSHSLYCNKYLYMLPFYKAPIFEIYCPSFKYVSSYCISLYVYY